MPASLYQSNFNMERIANFEDTNSAATVKLALELASFGSNFGFDSSELQLGGGDPLSMGSGPTLAQLDEKARKSQNMTECVPVPTSEHVAEIVGRQGEFLLLAAGYRLCWSCGWVAGCGKYERESGGTAADSVPAPNNQQTNRSSARQQPAASRTLLITF